MEYKAIYAFSGDPITYGHLDIIKRAIVSFGSILVAIGDNPDKKYLFSHEERVQMSKEVLKSFPMVKVAPFKGMLTDFAYEQKIGIIVRGIRNNSDFEYENLLFQLFQKQRKNIDFHFLIANPRLVHISSGVTKAIQKEQGNILEYVPLSIKAALERKISGQIILGVTGEVGSGKSFVSAALSQQFKTKGISCHHIDLDCLVHEILEQEKAPIYETFRRQIVEKYGENILYGNGYINRIELGKHIFESSYSLDQINRLIKEPMVLKLKRTLYGKRGLILIDSALLAEVGWTPYSNNRMVVVESSEEVRQKRLKIRGWTFKKINERKAAQYSSEGKCEIFEKVIREKKFGKVYKFNNNGENFSFLLEELSSRLICDLKLNALDYEKLSVE